MDLKPISLKVPVDVLAAVDASAKALGVSRTAILLRPFTDREKPTELTITTNMAPDLQAFIAQRAKAQSITPSEWLELAVAAVRKRLAARAAAEPKTDPTTPVLGYELPFGQPEARPGSRLKQEGKKK